MEQYRMKAEDVAGVVDSAFHTGTQLIAFKRKNIQMVISNFGFDNPRANLVVDCGVSLTWLTARMSISLALA
jgi:hypothetical protein